MPTSKQLSRQNEICKWLAPLDNESGCDHYLEDLADARSLRLPNTCHWIKPRSEYEVWSTCEPSSKSSLLWIHAIPGAGKTILASYIIDDAVKSSSSTVLYFFFKNGDSDKNTAVAAVRALIYQLLQHSSFAHTKRLYDEIHKCKERTAHTRAVNLMQLWDVFAKHCSSVTSPIIVLDALDECRDISKLLPHVLRLTNIAQVRIAFTSRREPELKEALQGIQSLAIGLEDVRDDIRVYLDYRVATSRFMSDPRVRSRIVRILNAQSKGMFLWVRLMVDELESCVTIAQVEDTLSTLPEGLPEVYQRILRRLQTSLKRAQREFCSRLLKWLVLAKRPLRLREANEALRLEYANMAGGPTFAQNLLYSERDIGSICGSLVTVKKQVVELIHFSAKEFLLVPAEASILFGGLEAFLVDTAKDNAAIAGSCITYLKSKELAKEVYPADTCGQAFKQSFPFVEYACIHWISHVTEATGSAMANWKHGLHGFLVSRHPFFWIEKWFTFRRHSKSELCFEIQRLLDWATIDNTEFPLSPSVTDLFSLFLCWGQAFLHLLEDYGSMVDFYPGLVHQIDPRRFCHSIENRMLEAFCETTTIQRHDTIRTVPNLNEFSNVPDHRKLQKHATDDEKYALCHFDRRRNAVFTVDASPGRMPRLDCQEITTGRKLMPIFDNEFVDNTDALWAQGAVMNQEGNYLAVSYVFENDDDCQISTYTAVWALDSDLKFGQRRLTSWAQKVFSTIKVNEIETFSGFFSHRPIAFDESGDLCSQSGQIKMATGDETPFPASVLKYPRTITFSGNGEAAILEAEGADFWRLTMAGDWEAIPNSALKISYTFDVSHTGRFLVWETPIDARRPNHIFDDIKVKVFDTHTKTTITLLIPENRHVRDDTRFLFAEDESNLFGFIPKCGAAMDDYVILYVWRRYGNDFTLWNSKTLHGQVLGHYLDTEEQHLYIVASRRVWSRIDLKSKDLRNLDEDVQSVLIQDGGLSHRVSSDGSRLATLRTTQAQWV